MTLFNVHSLLLYAHRNTQAVAILRLATPPLTPKWSAALDWLEGELERRQVYPYTDWGRNTLQLTNENTSNSTFLERSNSAKTLLTKAREVFPATPPDALKQAAATGAKGSSTPARVGAAASSAKSEQSARPTAPLPTKSGNFADVGGSSSGRSGAFTSPQPQQRSPTVEEGEPDDETLEDQQQLGQSGEDGVDDPADEAMDEEEPDDEDDRAPSEDDDDVPESETYPVGGNGNQRSPLITSGNPVTGSTGTRRAPPPYTDDNEGDATKQHLVSGHGLEMPANLGFGSSTEREPEVFIPSGADEARPVASDEPASRPPTPSSQSPAPGGRMESTNL